MAHKFMIGQRVNFLQGVMRSVSVGGYEIRRLVPAADSDADDPRYCIKSPNEIYERVALESQLTRLAAFH